MMQVFTKDGKMHSYEVSGNKVIATIKINGQWVSNPTYDVFKEDGYVEYVPTPTTPTRDELISRYIREHGYPTYDSELAVINNYTYDKKTYGEEWSAYMTVRNEAKQYATDFLNPLVVEEGSQEETQEEVVNSEEENSITEEV